MPNIRLNPKFVTHTKINSLWEQIILPLDSHLPSASDPPQFLDEVPDNELGKYGISRVPFDFEIKNYDSNNTEYPPVLFCPFLNQSSTDIQPTRPSWILRLLSFVTIILLQILRLLIGVSGIHGTVLWKFIAILLHGLVGPIQEGEYLHLTLSYATILPANVFLLGGGFENFRLPFYGSWQARAVLEYRENDKLHHPHVILITLQSCNGQEDSMLMGELAPIIEAMKNHADQPRVLEGDDEEKLFEALENDPTIRKELAFAQGTRFPILMASLLGPQHARLFYACMDNDQLVIRQSKLFSFEKGATAPWDFFACWLLSRPLPEYAAE
ncbi:hypothetical protein PHISCL_04996 [Aspergillus sclerotialis]|uniref:Uncharacterized protein n=1 Tax=Aspergillus sclerotialis TaxID=2070753 RepID=A0A3A2ZHR2_9EURO|nr:hypothetical protein PHISCL_04996 [Aspergillus sclerotialis]